MDQRPDSHGQYSEFFGFINWAPIEFHRGRRFYLIALTLILVAACSRAPSSTVGHYEAIECPLEVSAEQEVQCAFFSVPERHDRRDGKVIQVAIAQFLSTNPDAAPDPLVLLSGGPGDSNFQSFFPMLSGPLGQVLLSQRDVVIIESRGLFHSRPNLITEEVFAAQLEMVGSNVLGEEAKSILLAAVRRSYARFMEEGIDVPAYNNVETAADIDFILATLGYEQFNLFGTSAGTLVAQMVMRNHPDRLRAVILNAAVPEGSALFENMMGNAARSLSEYFARCEADEACSVAYPQLEARFLNLLAELNASPVQLDVKNPMTQETMTLVLNGDKVSSWVFLSMYWNTQIIRSIDKFSKGDFTEIKENPGTFFPMSHFAYPLGYIAATAENPDFHVSSGTTPDGYQIFLDGLNLTFSPQLIEASRDMWRDKRPAPASAEPLKSDIPTLIMNGALDHVIPQESLDRLTSGLQNSYQFVFEGVAHSPVDTGQCGLRMTMEFLADPSSAPDSACMEAYRHTFVVPD